jgi:hypothetical protein
MILLAIQIPHKLICEEELDTRCDRRIDDQFAGFVLCCASGDAVDDGILSRKCLGEGG